MSAAADDARDVNPPAPRRFSSKELILVLVLGVPRGRFLPSRKLAVAVLMAALLIVLPFQTVSVSNEGNMDWSYWLVQVMQPSALAWWPSEPAGRQGGA